MNYFKLKRWYSMSLGFGLHSLSSQSEMNSVADAVRHSQLPTVTYLNWGCSMWENNLLSASRCPDVSHRWSRYIDKTCFTVAGCVARTLIRGPGNIVWALMPRVIVDPVCSCPCFVKSVISKYVEVYSDYSVYSETMCTDGIRSDQGPWEFVDLMPSVASLGQSCRVMQSCSKMFQAFQSKFNPITADNRSKFSAFGLGLLWRKAFENRPTNSRWEQLVSRLLKHRDCEQVQFLFSLKENIYLA